MDERLGRRTRASVLRRQRQGRRLRACRTAARHVHDRGLAREARRADAAGHDRSQGVEKALVRLQGVMLQLFAMLVAATTGVLILAGGLVTSTESGLSVPDWPNTYGYFMFFFPLEKMVGGIRYEHTHRLIASTVGFLILVLAAWLWRAETRRWVRRLGYLALASVITQGILGGITVLWYLPDPISIAHASLAQIVFCLTTAIALFTSRGWTEARPSLPAGAVADDAVLR